MSLSFNVTVFNLLSHLDFRPSIKETHPVLKEYNSSKKGFPSVFSHHTYCPSDKMGIRIEWHSKFPERGKDDT